MIDALEQQTIHSAARKEVSSITPKEGWWRSSTWEAVETALVRSPRESWPFIIAAVEAMRNEYGD